MKTITDAEFSIMFEQYWNTLEECGVSSFFEKEKLYADLRNAAGGLNEDTGVAYPGGLLHYMNLCVAVGKRVYNIVNKYCPLDLVSVKKVLALMHLSKIVLFTQNHDAWQIEKLGKNYIFNPNLTESLKFGERSLLIVMNLGIKLTGEEFEAFRCIDKKSELVRDGNQYNSMLTIIVKTANEITTKLETIRLFRENP